MQDRPLGEPTNLFDDQTAATLSLGDEPTGDANERPFQMALQVGPTGRTVARHALVHSGLADALLCRMEVVGLLLPIAGTQGRRYDADAVAAMWRAVARTCQQGAASVPDVERFVREREASRG